MEQQMKAPPDIKKVAQFLRGAGAGMKVRVGAMNGKRLDYFKGVLLTCSTTCEEQRQLFTRQSCNQSPPFTCLR